MKYWFSVEIASILLAKEVIRSQRWKVGRNKKEEKKKKKIVPSALEGDFGPAITTFY